MLHIPKGILPAIRKMKDFDRVLQTNHETIIFLETRLDQLKSLVEYTKRANKQALIHFDLIQGLKSDEYGMEYVVREVKPNGILSTRGNIITLAKRHHLLAIQRLFLLDSGALEHNLQLIKRLEPDCIEVLPGLIPSMIEKIHTETDLPVIAGGLITEKSHIDDALKAGAIAVSTSNSELWNRKQSHPFTELT